MTKLTISPSHLCRISPHFFRSLNLSYLNSLFFCFLPKQWPLAGEFVEFEYSPKIHHFGKLAGLDTFADIGHPTLPGLDTFARHLPTILLGLARLAKGKFGDFYTNLANLVSLANLASVD